MGNREREVFAIRADARAGTSADDRLRPPGMGFANLSFRIHHSRFPQLFILHAVRPMRAQARSRILTP